MVLGVKGLEVGGLQVRGVMTVGGVLGVEDGDAGLVVEMGLGF